MLGAFFEKFLPYLPYVALGAIALGTIIIVFLVVSAVTAVKKAAKKRALSRPLMGNEDPQKELFKSGFFSFFRTIQQKWKGLEKNTLNFSFDQTKILLKEYLGGRDPQYQLPWYLLLGAEGAGKTTLLKDVDLELPIGRPDFHSHEEESKIDWFFFNHGIVIDVKGNLILNKDSLLHDEEQWEYFLRLLTRYREKRPLDGLMLAIPMDELRGDTLLSDQEILERAQVINEKINKLVAFTAMNVPIYLVLTKCDLVPGFNTFAQEVAQDHQHEMVGWSSPYQADMPYHPSWIKEIFESLDRCFKRVRDRHFVEKQDAADTHELYRLPLEISALQQKVSLYLNAIFKENFYSDPLCLRGVYLVGQGKSQHSFVEDLLFVDPLEENYLRASSATQEEKKSSAEASRGFKKQVLFLRDLFEAKVFSEASLARPVVKLIAKTNRLLNYAKGFTLGISVIWLVGILWSNHTLNHHIQEILPSLTEINKSITEVSKRQSLAAENDQMMTYLHERAESILEKFTRIHMTSTKSIFLPASWMSPIDNNITRAFVKAYDKIIIPSLYTALNKKAATLTMVQKIKVDQNYHAKQVLNPTSSNTYHYFKSYVHEIRTLEEHVKIYNTLSENLDAKAFGNLMNYLFQSNFPADFYVDDKYYVDALQKILDQPVDLSPYRAAAAEKLGHIYRQFLSRAFNMKEHYSAFLKLSHLMKPLEDMKRVHNIDANELKPIVEKAIVVADLISDPEFNWINSLSFEPSREYSDLMSIISKSELLGGDIADELVKVSNREYANFKMDLTKIEFPLIGSIFEFKQNQITSIPSARLIEFIDSISAFLQEPFMERVSSTEWVNKVKAGRLLFWDEVLLKRLVDVVEGYSRYQNNKIKNYAEPLRKIISLIAHNNMRSVVHHYIGQAQSFQDQPHGVPHMGAREILHSQVSNLVAVTPFFSKILGVLETSGDHALNHHKLREFLISQNYQILERIESLLDAENLYSTNMEALRNWDGSGALSYHIFDIDTDHDLHAYLSGQRERVMYLGKQMAEPILALLNLGYFDSIPYDLPLIPKWAKIVAILNEYEKKTPGNSLKLLEDFVGKEVDELTFDQCMEGDFFEGDYGKDYFLDVKSQILNTLHKSCKTKTNKNAGSRYTELADFFNQNLAGRFPFSEIQKPTPLEAESEDVKIFLDLFNQLSPHEIDVLKTSPHYNTATLKTADFINQIEQTKPLLSAAISSNESHVKVKIDVKFRTDQKREIGGDKIITWAIESGEAVVTNKAKKLSTEWQAGDPFTVALRWANDATISPQIDEQQTALTIMDSTAFFSYTGRWSFIKLLQDHMVREKIDLKDPFPIALEFRVPVSEKEAGKKIKPIALHRSLMSHPYTVVYVRMALSAMGAQKPDGKSPPKGTKITIFPKFPVHAPMFR